jgi:hypothetical protein
MFDLLSYKFWKATGYGGIKTVKVKPLKTYPNIANLGG